MLLRNVWSFWWCGMRRPDSDTPRGADAPVSNTLTSCVPPLQEHWIIDPHRLSPSLELSPKSQCSLTHRRVFQNPFFWEKHTHKKERFYKSLHIYSAYQAPKTNKMSTCLQMVVHLSHSSVGETLGYTIRITHSAKSVWCEERVWLGFKQENSSFSDFFLTSLPYKNIKMNFKSEMKPVLSIN